MAMGQRREERQETLFVATDRLPKMASAEPHDPPEPVAPPDLRRGLPVWTSARRPAPEAAGAARHGQAEPPARGVLGVDPGSAPGLHHVGTIRGQSGSPRSQPCQARQAGRSTPGVFAARRLAPVRAVRAADARPVCGAEGSALLPMHTWFRRLRRAAMPVSLGSRPGRVRPRANLGGRRPGGAGGELGGGGRGRAGANGTVPAIATATGAGEVRGREGGAAVPGVRAGLCPVPDYAQHAAAGLTPAGPAAGRGPHNPVTVPPGSGATRHPPGSGSRGSAAPRSARGPAPSARDPPRRNGASSPWPRAPATARSR
jgi:hypothetical protein